MSAGEDVRDSIDAMRSVLKVLQDVTARDGRPQHWAKVRQ